MISAIYSIYDVLGWSSPVTITAKLIFSAGRLLKLHWDPEVPAEIQTEWKSWAHSLQKAPTLTLDELGCEQSFCLCCIVHCVISRLDTSRPELTCSQMKSSTKGYEHPATGVGHHAHIGET